MRQANYLNMVKNDLATDKGGQTRRQIFESALELFREKGFDSTTMQEIAAHARVVKSAAYYYFPSKEAIIQAYFAKINSTACCTRRSGSISILPLGVHR